MTIHFQERGKKNPKEQPSLDDVTTIPIDTMEDILTTIDEIKALVDEIKDKRSK